ncbi:MAG: tryptophanase [Candidatus Niyogibacteria bacterium]|nr:tryptophanase [Candidatus Niyogibacteria bacterium]
MATYPFTPYKNWVIDPIPNVSLREAERQLKLAHYNPFNVPARKVVVDFMTDSGTGALSKKQLSRMVAGDESYAGSVSGERLYERLEDFTGRQTIILTHQGRGAEKIIAETFLQKDDVVLSNTLFDTTRANFEHRGAHCVDLPWHPASLWNTKINDIIRDPEDPFSGHLFKGDVALDQLAFELARYGDRVKLVVLTLTNNSGGGQPASLKNIVAAARIVKEHSRALLMIDACRIVENAYFIQRYELKGRVSIAGIVRKICAYADLISMSAKKDGLAHMGGCIATSSTAPWVGTMNALSILYEGLNIRGKGGYGGISGKDMEIIAQGLCEVVDLRYLRHRAGQVRYLHERLTEIGIPLISPLGGHAVYVDAAAFLPHIPAKEFPGHALVVELYRQGGVRSVEIGSLMFGKNAQRELVRLAIPRRVYEQSHFDYVVEALAKINERKERLRGFQITEGAGDPMPHFFCKLKPL